MSRGELIKKATAIIARSDLDRHSIDVDTIAEDVVAAIEPMILRMASEMAWCGTDTNLFHELAEIAERAS